MAPHGFRTGTRFMPAGLFLTAASLLGSRGLGRLEALRWPWRLL
ncbi:hypothetical protein [Kribbella sp. HUAS MG21]|uniref:Uncharacterized protein n=1 Tax=Kribbella sp. HUAS MG21 TaxID=3160966 RepID=A0AAU7TDA0_9ACTN